MLFVGNQRGGGRDLALHLMKDDNELVQLHELRGFASNNLESAFKESYAISRATKCKQHLFSLSINAPPIEDASDNDFIDAIDRAENALGLTGQPRAIVFHEKKGRDGETRRHAHAVWSRIDINTMTAKQLSFTKDKLMTLSRELYIEKDWRMPPGMLHKPDRDPRNFTLEQWQQAKRAGKDPQKLIGIFQDCWSVSDSVVSFGHALEEHGIVLAKGRRGFVGVDHDGEVYAVSKWTKKKAKEVREKLGSPDHLPDVDQAHEQAAKMVADRLQDIRAEEAQAEEMRLERLAQEHMRQEEQARLDRERQLLDQRRRRREEAAARAERLRKGLLGLLDRFTGKRRHTLEQNARDAAQTYQRDQLERKAREQLETRQRAVSEQKRVSLKEHYQAVQTELRDDIERITPSKEQQIQDLQKRLSQNRQNCRSRPRNRDGPSLAR